ncbi:ATP-dependent DNA helicase RecQ [Caldifermentibacillus hisashii]|uniref:RecQ family ATP-dependent DNA helicase n=1 Tax=Caldifermentibacillus hisashii TaxID=996558 RepID=UPI0031018F7A
MELEKILYEKFSYTQFRKGQKEIIQSILNEKDTLALLPTGTGKSLCYQLPGYLMKGMVLIISPLLSLMQDQVEQMKIRGEKRVVAINSFLTREERRSVLQNVHKYKFIYISPELIQNDFIFKKIKSVPVSLLVIDEAHCISQWGYDFRPDYLELGRIRRELGNPVTLALTATAREDVQNDIKKFLHMENAEEYINSVDRPNIALQVIKVRDYQTKKQHLFELVKQLTGPGILYFSSKKLANEVAKELNERSLGPAAAYHSGIDQEMRILLQQQFLYDELKIMCATSAFGMGVNKENVRYIIHFHPPINLESYLQEIGRAGRDGEKSIAVMLYADDDIFLQQQLLESEYPSDIQIEHFSRLQRLKNFPNNIDGNVPEKTAVPEGYTEVQWRLLWKFYINSKDENDFKRKLRSFIDERLAIKKVKLQEITDWIEYEGCRRERLLMSFQETKRERHDNCCDNCGLDLSCYQQANALKKQVLPINWRHRLAELFSIEMEI